MCVFGRSKHLLETLAFKVKKITFGCKWLSRLYWTGRTIPTYPQPKEKYPFNGQYLSGFISLLYSNYCFQGIMIRRWGSQFMLRRWVDSTDWSVLERVRPSLVVVSSSIYWSGLSRTQL